MFQIQVSNEGERWKLEEYIMLQNHFLRRCITILNFAFVGTIMFPRNPKKKKEASL